MTARSPLKTLFEAVAARRWDDAKAAAQALAAHEQARGRHALARDLRRTLEPGATEQAFSVAAVSGSSLAPLPSDVSLQDVVLPEAVRRELEALLEERRHAARLLKAGLGQRKRLLLHGPPGCGKSMLARALAVELKLPAYLVRFDALIGSWLGQTAQRVQEVFQFASTVPSVVLVDEIDAVSRSRGRSNDVGEMDRAVIALLQGLEHQEPAGLFVATTNLAAHLDPAIWRRFDLVIELPRPSPSAVMAYARARAAAGGLHINGELKTVGARWKSFADAARTIDDLRRRHIIEGE